MLCCVPVMGGGWIDPRWGRARRVALARVEGGAIRDWTEVEVEWDALKDQGSEGAHHARVARFIREQGVDAVVAHHMGDDMHHMLGTMGVAVWLGAEGGARDAVLAAAARQSPGAHEGFPP